jgi:hypothetical protein
LGKFRKELPHFEKKSFEIVKIFGGFGQILLVPQHVLGFLDFLFFYLSYSQIWLNPLVATCYFWRNMRKLRKNTYFYAIFLKIFSKEKKGKDALKQRQVFLVVKNSQKAMIKIWY